MDATLSCIRESRDRSQPLAVFFLDIDDFKHVNDEFGHHIGDEVLRAIASTLNDVAIDGGFVGRYGGEEFVVVVTNVDEQEARQRARTLIERVRNIRVAALGPRAVTCSIGAVWGRPRPGTSAADRFTSALYLVIPIRISWSVFNG